MLKKYIFACEMNGNEFLAMDKIFSWLRIHFPSISQANMYFFSIRIFLPKKKSFVQVDGQGINLLLVETPQFLSYIVYLRRF